MSQIKEICERLDIPQDHVRRELYKRDETHYDDVLPALKELNAVSEGQIIIYGGQTTHPSLLGYRKMRLPSDDIDCVCSESGIGLINDNYGREYSNGKGPKICYYEPFDTLFMYFDGFPTDLVSENFHDWEIPEDIEEFKTVVPLGDNEISVCRPEYTIMLKMKRAKDHNNFWGKDQIDIAHLLLSPGEKEELKDVDLKEASHLIEENVTEDKEVIERYLSELKSGVGALRKEENEKLKEKVKEFERALTRQYRNSYVISTPEKSKEPAKLG